MHYDVKLVHLEQMISQLIAGMHTVNAGVAQAQAGVHDVHDLAKLLERTDAEQEDYEARRDEINTTKAPRVLTGGWV